MRALYGEPCFASSLVCTQQLMTEWAWDAARVTEGLSRAATPRVHTPPGQQATEAAAEAAAARRRPGPPGAARALGTAAACCPGLQAGRTASGWSAPAQLGCSSHLQRAARPHCPANPLPPAAAAAAFLPHAPCRADGARAAPLTPRPSRPPGHRITYYLVFTLQATGLRAPPCELTVGSDALFGLQLMRRLPAAAYEFLISTWICWNLVEPK